MNSNNLFRNTLLLATVWLISLNFTSLRADVLKLDFSGVLTSGTCTFDVDKSTLPLGRFSVSGLKPSTLTGVAPLTLSITDCKNIEPTLTPVVHVGGEGISQDGKWLFRSGDSTAEAVGVMLIKTNSPPNYSDTEVKHGETFPLAAMGVNPIDQSMTFYAGLACGSAATCSGVTPGSVTARILFSLDFH